MGYEQVTHYIRMDARSFLVQMIVAIGVIALGVLTLPLSIIFLDQIFLNVLIGLVTGFALIWGFFARQYWAETKVLLDRAWRNSQRRASRRLMAEVEEDDV